jgi:agmatinase
MSKQKKIEQFDPNGPATHVGIFGLPFTTDEAEVIIVPVPWEVTVSYGFGTASGPAAVKEASYQVDLYDPAVPNAWQMGLAMAEIDQKLFNKSNRYRAIARDLITGDLDSTTNEYEIALREVNTACAEMVLEIRQQCADLLDSGKLVALLGGDHSTPLGYLQALAERHSDFGILQIDAHADLRKAYEGFTYSHASIMYNAMQLPEVAKLVQVGIRDYCQEEADLIQNNPDRITTFFDRSLKNEQYRGQTWAQQVHDIISRLPEKVYLSFDIDGLDPKLCPNTGTPVAGGLEVEQILYLIEQLVHQGKTLIGFDLSEVVPGTNEWDANVGARLLYSLCNLLGKSNRRI